MVLEQTSLGINTGGRYFAVGDVVTLYDHSEVGGAAGVGTPFTATIGSVETRLYLKLTNNQKFTGSAVLTDYIADGNAVAITTSQVGSAVSFTFTPTDIAVGGDIDFAQDRILCGAATAKHYSRTETHSSSQLMLELQFLLSRFQILTTSRKLVLVLPQLNFIPTTL